MKTSEIFIFVQDYFYEVELAKAYFCSKLLHFLIKVAFLDVVISLDKDALNVGLRMAIQNVHNAMPELRRMI